MKKYIKPIAKEVILNTQSLLSGSDTPSVDVDNTSITGDQVGAKESIWNWMEE